MNTLRGASCFSASLKAGAWVFGANHEETLDAAMCAQTVGEEEEDEEGEEGDSDEGEEEGQAGDSGERE